MVCLLLSSDLRLPSFAPSRNFLSLRRVIVAFLGDVFSILWHIATLFWGWLPTVFSALAILSSPLRSFVSSHSTPRSFDRASFLLLISWLRLDFDDLGESSIYVNIAILSTSIYNINMRVQNLLWSALLVQSITALSVDTTSVGKSPNKSAVSWQY